MSEPRSPDGGGRVDVLIVGAGPTGLMLAAVLQTFGLTVRVVDAATDRSQESRALAVQPRTLEVLRLLGLDGPLIARGSPAVRLRITVAGRGIETPMFDIGAEDTAFPFLLFVSQSETEELLGDHLSGRGVDVERGVTFESSERAGAELVCTVRSTDGGRDLVRARWLVGCDGARSTVRDLSGIAFRGGQYPQTFLLADLHAEGLVPGAVNTFLGETGPLLFFPLARPAPWRLITMRADPSPQGPTAAEVAVPELQRLSDRATGGGVRLHDPVWTSAFRVHHRIAGRFRAGQAFLAGDAAHVHSPVGAQGMNTGIQDAVNLGWKLALVRHGAPESLLDSYDAERRPVGEFVLRFTDQAFTVATSAHPLVRAARAHVVPRVLPWALRLRPVRAMAFRTISQLGIRYRNSPAVEPARHPRRGPRPGDRLPDARVRRGTHDLWLQQALATPTFHLLLCGPAQAWDAAAVEDLRERFVPWLTVHRLLPAGASPTAGAGDLVDAGEALRRLRVRRVAQLVVRPDGHLGYRCDGGDLSGAARHLARWLPARSADRERVGRRR